VNAAPQAVAASGLACSELTVEVADRALVRDLQLTIASGAVTAILGVPFFLAQLRKAA